MLLRRSNGPGPAVLGRFAIALLGPLVLLLPWSLYVLANPSLLLLEPGLSGGAVTGAQIAPWELLLLHPGGPGMTPVWISAGLVVAGLLALLRRDRLPITGGFAVLGGLALLLGAIQAVVQVTPPGSTMRWRRPASPRWPTGLSATCRAASVSVCGSPWPSPRSRACSCSTSRRPSSI